MAYANAIFFVDYEGGSDAARSALTSCTISNPSGTIISVNKTAHGLVAGAIFDATLFTAWFNSAWKVLSVTDADNFVVDGVWQAAADPSGTITPRGGSSKSDAWKTWNSGATAARIQPGDFIRTMASPDPTSLGVTGVWTDGPLPSTQAVTSSTNATPIVVTRAAHGYANGDTVVITGHTTNTNANGTWIVANQTTNTFELQGSVGNGVGGAAGTVRRVNNCVVTLSAAVTKNVASPVDGVTGGQGTKPNWTASANVTCTVASGGKQGVEFQQIAIGASFTTGLAAYYTLPLLTDLSAYQQLSFWVYQSAGTLGAAGAVRVRLCTDTVGAVPVHSFDIPELGALNQWLAVTVDSGGALNAAINSISFEVVTDNGAQTFNIDNVIAVKAPSAADSLSLNSLLGKNTAGESWLAIQSIVDTRVFLDQGVNYGPASASTRGYSGTSETVTTYKREPLLRTLGAAQPNPLEFFMNEDGSAGSPITYSAGWDRTAMASQSGQTWFSLRNGLNNGLGCGANGRSYVVLDGQFGVVRGLTGFVMLGQCQAIALGDFHGNNNSGGAVNITSSSSISAKRVSGSISARNNGFFASLGAIQLVSDESALGDVVMHGNESLGIRLLSGRTTVESIDARNNGTYALQVFPHAERSYVRAMNTAGNGSGAVDFIAAAQIYVKNATLAESTEVNTASADGGNPRLISEAHDGTPGNTQVFTDGGRIASEATVRHTASGLAWSMAVTSTNRHASYPLSQEVAAIAVAAGTLVTASLWMRRTNTGLTFSLMCKGGQIGGVDNDVSTAMTAAADTWEQVQITFTTSEAGVVSITAEAYGGTTYIGYFDDFSATQA